MGLITTLLAAGKLDETVEIADRLKEQHRPQRPASGGANQPKISTPNPENSEAAMGGKTNGFRATAIGEIT